MRSKAATDNPLEKSLRLCYYLYRQLSIDYSRFICGKAYTMNLFKLTKTGCISFLKRRKISAASCCTSSALPFDERSLLHVHDRETGGLRLNTERYNLLEIMISGQNRPASATATNTFPQAPATA